MLAILSMFGCKSADEVTNCVYYLNEKEFQRVADDETCSTYERASAELGMAGFLFANFLESDAADNFRQALGIPDTAEYWSTWDGRAHYREARRLSGDSSGDVYEGKSRSNADIEIHYFASLAGLLAQTYIELDKDANGDVSETEIQNFTQLRAATDADFGENEIVTADWIEFVTDPGQAGEKVYLLNLTAAGNSCLPKTSQPKFDGIWGSATGYDMTDSTNCGLIPVPSAQTLAQWAVAGRGTLSITGKCSVVTQVEQVQNLFSSGAGGSDALTVVELTENYVSYLDSIQSDLEALGIEEDSELRRSLREFNETMDNGGSCSNTTVNEVDQVFKIIEVAAEDATTDYRNLNVMAMNDVTAASDRTIELVDFSTTVEYNTGTRIVPVTITFSCTNEDNLSARLIYKSGSGYVAYYQGADESITNTFSNLKNLNFDDEGDQKADVAGDGVISFKELLCMQ